MEKVIGSAPEVGTTTIKAGEGKNTVSKQEQQSEKNSQGAEKTYWETFKDGVAKGYAEITKAVGDLTGKQQIERMDENSQKQCCGGGVGVRGTPTPDAPVDPAHLPSYLQGKAKGKTPAEKEAERKRQVSLPNDERGRTPDKTDLEKIYMSPEEMQKRTLDRMTGGKIDPAEGDGTTKGGKATKQAKTGKGPQPGDPIEEILGAGGAGTTTGPSKPSKTGQ